MNIFEEAKKLASQRYNRDKLLSTTGNLITRFRFSAQDKPRLQLACGRLADVLDRLSGSTLQQRWTYFEKRIWTKWKAGSGRPSSLWTWGARGTCPHTHGRSVD
jgi:hypothetical protein